MFIGYRRSLLGQAKGHVWPDHILRQLEQLLYGSSRRPAGLGRLMEDRPGVRHRTDVPELIWVDHAADRLDPPVQDVEHQGADHLAVAIADDRAGLAVHLVRLHDPADPDEQ